MKTCTFQQFLLKICGISASTPNVYIPLEDNTSFLQQFFRFQGGDNPAFPPPDAPGLI